MLSSDRVGPLIFEVAKSNFDKIQSQDRQEIFEVASKLFTYLFIAKIQGSAKVFFPTHSAPLNVDRWLFRSGSQLPSTLPQSLVQSVKLRKSLNEHLTYICEATWTVLDPTTDQFTGYRNQGESNCLKTLNGWSLCFNEVALPDDYGKALETMAGNMARASASLMRQKKHGPKSDKKAKLVTQLHILFPKGLPDKPAKIIRRELETTFDLPSMGLEVFSEGTLRSAMSEIQKRSLTAH